MANKWSRVMVCAAMLALGFSACSNNDPGSTPAPEDMSSGTQDMPAEKDMSSDRDDMPAGKEDMSSQNMADMSATPDMQPDDMGFVDMPAGMDMLAGVDMADMSDMAEEMDMLVYPDLMDYACAFPSTDPMCPTGAFGPGAFVTKFEIATDNSCCRDFNGDGRPENIIGAQILASAQSLSGVDVNANLATAIEQGETVFLFEFEDWQNDRFDPMLITRILTGTDTDLDYTDNLAGSGSFIVSDESYDDTGAPLTQFQTSRVYDGELAARGSRLRIYFPGLLDAVNLTLTDVHIDARITPGADLAAGGGVEMLEGELSGALLRDEFFNSLNVVSNKCPCLARDLYTKKEDGSYDCTITQHECTNSPDSACRLTGRQDICGGLEIYSKRVDVDTDGDGKRDAFSFGARFEAVPTTLTEAP